MEQSGKVAGAVHVPRGMLEFRADPESPYYDQNFAKDKTVIVYCAAGGRAALSGQALKEMGYGEVYNLGGFGDWAEAGGAIEQALTIEECGRAPRRLRGARPSSGPGVSAALRTPARSVSSVSVSRKNRQGCPN